MPDEAKATTSTGQAPEASRRARLIRGVSLAGIGFSVLTLISYGFLYLQQQNWRLLVDGGGVLLSLGLLVVAYWTARRDKLDLAGHLMLAAVVLAFATTELVWIGETVYNTISGVLLLIVIGVIALRHKPRSWLIAIGTFLILVLLFNQLEPLPRYDALADSPGLLIVDVVLTVALLGIIFWMVARSFQTGTIRTRLVIALMVTALLPVVVIAVSAGLAGYLGSRNRAMAQLASVADLKEAEIQTWALSLREGMIIPLGDEEIARARVLLEEPSNTYAYRRAYDGLKEQLAYTLAHTDRFDEMFLMNRAGQLILSTQPEHEGDRYSTSLAYFSEDAYRKAPEREAYVLPPVYYRLLDQVTVMTMRPVLDRDGALVGFLAGRASMDRLTRILSESAGLGETGETYLVSNNRQLIAGSRITQDRITVQTEGARAAIDQRDDGVDLYENYADIPVVGAYRWLPGLEVGLLAERSQAEAFRANRVTLGSIAGVALLGALFAIGTASFLTRSIATPLSDLAETASQIAGGDLDREAQVAREDEIGSLAHAFNEMTARLRELIDTLEQRVATRTAELARRSNQLEAAAQVAREAATIRDVDQMLFDTVELISEHFGFYHVGIFLLDEAAEYAVLEAANSAGGRRMLASGHMLKVGAEGIVGYVTHTGEARIALDVGADAVFFDNPHLPNTRSEMALPLQVGGEIIGALDVQSTEKAAFTEEDVAVLSTLADQVAIAIQNSRLVAQTQQALDEVQTLNRRYLQREWSELSAERGLITYEYADSKGSAPLTPDDGGNGHGQPETAELAVPIRVRDQVIGQIDLLETDGGRVWSEEDIRLVETISDQMAQALENVRLIEKTQQRVQELALLFSSSQRLSGAPLQPDEIAEITARQFLDVLDFPEASLSLIGPDGKTLHVLTDLYRDEDRIVPEPLVSFSLSDYPATAQAMDTLEPLVIQASDPNADIAELQYMREHGIKTNVIIPLAVKGTALGVIELGSFDRERHPAPQEINLAMTLANQAAVILDNARLFEETESHAEEMAVLNDLAQALTATLEARQVIKEAYVGAARLLDASNFSVALYDRKSNRISFPFAVRDDEPVQRSPRSWNNGLIEHVIQEREPVLLRGDVSQRLADLGVDVFGDPPVSWLAVPMTVGDQVLGVMALQSFTDPRSYDEHHRDLLSAVASQAAIALQSANLFEETQEALTETAVLYRIGRAVGRLGDLSETFQDLADAVVEELGYASSWIALVDRQRNLLQGVAGAGEYITDEVVYSETVLEADVHSPAVQAVLKGDPLIVNEIPTKDQATDPDQATRPFLGRVLSVPIVVEDEAEGVITVSRTMEDAEFTERDLELMTAVAGQASVAFQNVNLVEETQRRATQLETAAAVSGAASSMLSLDELLPQTVELIRNRFELYYAGIFLLDNTRQWAILRAGTGQAGQTMLERKHKLEVGGESMIGQCTAQGEAQISFDVISNNPLLPDTRSEMALPLKSRGRTIGAMTIQADRPAAFSPEDITVIQTMADQLANAIQNAQLFEETERALAETRDLYETSQAIGGATTPDAVRRALLAYASRTEAEVARILLLETDETGTPSRVVTAESWTIDGRPTQPPGTRLPADSALMEFLHTPDPATIEDMYADPRVNENVQLFMEITGLRSFAIVPIAVGQRFVGGVLIGRDIPYRFRKKAMRGLQTLASQAAIALENLRLLEETRRRAQELEAINEVGQTITSVLELDGLIRQVVDITKARFGHYFVGITLVEGDRVVFRDGSTIGASDVRLERGRLNLKLDGPGLIPQAARTGEPVLVRDVLEEPRYIAVPELEGTRSELVMPIEVKGRIVGALDVQSDQLAAYGQPDIALLQSLTSQIGVAIENARLFEETQAEAQRRTLINEVLQAAATSLEPEELLHRAGRAISGHTQAPSILLLWEPGMRVLRPIAVHEADASLLALPEDLLITHDMSPTLFEAVEKQRPRVLEDVSSLAPPLDALAEHLGAEAFIFVPLAFRDRVMGALALVDVDGEVGLDTQDIGFAKVIANNLSVSLDSAFLYQDAVETAERLAEVDRLKSQFLANMSHELRTPLNSIIGFSRVILKGIDGPLTDMQRQDLEAIYTSGQHLLGLINDILDISKIEAGKMELAFEPVRLDEIVNGVLSTAVALVKDKPIELQQSLPDDLPEVIGDQRRIRQILLNLIGNAAKFTEDGFIRVSAEADDTYVTFAVADSGIGIPSQKRGTIFEAFTQVDASATRKYQGTGLGLTVTRSLVELHGGRIWVESEVDVGSTFFFTLPIQGPESVEQEEQEKPAEAPAVEIAPPDLSEFLQQHGEAETDGQLVLCVDDDEGVLTLFRRYLKKRGYQVVGLTEPSRVLEQARRLSPFAITLDVMMPDIDGWQVIQDLKSDPATRSIPVIMCTIVSDKGRGLSLGASDYLVKPILEQDLLDALSRLDRKAGQHRVLVVDDSAEDRSLLRRLIESQPGYEVVEATSGQEAINLVQAVTPDIIILDLMMPQMDGFAVLETLKSDKDTRTIPIIVVTAKELTDEERDVLNHQIEDLIQKGMLERDELVQDVAAALDKMGPGHADSPDAEGRSAESDGPGETSS
ncbi:MAG: GAF domain-containing protein [Anaerolineae bacterium]|jgi:GAF domain-containing protein/CheY-like chemotaxis protein/HAMP domain-containing protein